MTIFTIDSENNIVAHHAQSEITDKEAEQFTSEKELVGLAADWPGNRLVEVWNGIPGLTRVKRFTSRRLAIGRIWQNPKARTYRRSGILGLQTKLFRALFASLKGCGEWDVQGIPPVLFRKMAGSDPGQDR